MPPLMLACVMSTLVAQRLHAESIYTEPLRRKGLSLRGEPVRRHGHGTSRGRSHAGAGAANPRKGAAE